MNSSQLINALSDICGADYVQPPEAISDKLLCDWTNTVQGRADAAVFPHTAQEVSSVLSWCNQQGVKVTVQGGNTGMSGGAVPLAQTDDTTIILALQRMNRIRAVNPVERTITAEAGCILENIHQQAQAHNLCFPLSLGAKGSCHIGGNLATNAGGLNVLRYGTARNLCLGIEAVLADGRILPALSALHKNNSGYDLKNLIIGSEGTLAVITAATLKLFPAPQEICTAWINPSSAHNTLELMNFIQHQSGNALLAFEVMPDSMLKHIARLAPDLAFPQRNAPPPWSVLLETAQVPAEQMQDILLRGIKQGLAEEVIIASSPSQRAAFWRVREEAPLILSRLGKWLRADIALPLSALPVFVEEIRQQLSAISDGTYIIGFGHWGDGNLHLAARPLHQDPQQNPALAAAVKNAIYDCTAKHNGSFSAEHGIGQLKTALMRRYQDPVAYDLMRNIKQTMDRNNILNPGKVLE